MSDYDAEIELCAVALAAASSQREGIRRVLREQGRPLREAVRVYLASHKNDCGNGGPAFQCTRPDWCDRCDLREAADQ